MRTRQLISVSIFAITITAATLAGAEERPFCGSEEKDILLGTGFTDTVTAPADIVHEIGADISNFGVGGLVTGTVRGSVFAAGQVARGGFRMFVGVMDILTAPFKD